MHNAYTQNGLHLRVREGDGPPLVCLPPAPHSSLYFAPLYEALGDHPIMAVSYPGYGGSKRLANAPSIDAYADAILPALPDQVDLIGFHTGCLVAIALGERLGVRVRQTLMIDVPFFDAETRALYGSKLPAEGLPIPVEASFEKSVTGRAACVSEDRAFALWVETLRAGRYQSDAFRAAFAFECEARFAAYDRPTQILATKSGLLDPSRRASQVLPKAKITENLTITAPAFEAHSPAIADWIMTIINPE